ncbi:MAG: transposase [Aeriscardovia sp.]|nr:transposase [Aeriscardovia sp.]
MEQPIKIHCADELNTMNHQDMVDAYILLASREEELVAQISLMEKDYKMLLSDKKDADALIEKLAQMLPNILTQLSRLEKRVFGKHSRSYSNILGKKLTHKELFLTMQDLLDELKRMNNDGKKEKEKKEEEKKKDGKKKDGIETGEQGKTEKKTTAEEKKPEEGDGGQKQQAQPQQGTASNAPKVQVDHMSGNPNLSHVPKELCEYVGGSLDHIIVKVDPIFRTEDELKNSIGEVKDLSNVSILNDAQFYWSLENILGNVYPCLHISVKLKNKGKTIRNTHNGTIADQCLCSPSLGAMLIAKRFNLALPTARSESHEFPFIGLSIPRSKAYDWMNLCARYLKYANAYMLEKMMLRGVLIFDESFGKTREAGHYFYWACRTSENEDLEQLISFFYSKSHSAVIAKLLTHGFKGYLCADGLEVYEIVACEESGIKLCNCWNHVRTYLSDAFPGKEAVEMIKNGDAYKDFHTLEECLDLIKEMFHLDETHKHGAPEGYATIRETEIFPKAQEVITKLKEARERGGEYKYNATYKKAVDYVLEREDNLLRFVEDIRIPLSTNSLESKHAMVALGRNNFFLFDTENGARTGSHCYSLVAKARMDEVPVQDYLEFLLEVIPILVTMHMPEVLLYDKYEKKILKMVDEAIEWQKKHPGKSATLDFNSLGKRPSLAFLEPYLSGTKGSLFETWLREKEAYRKRLLAKSAQEITIANLEESGLSANTIKRIVDRGVKSQTEKKDVRAGLEQLEKYIEDFKTSFDPSVKNKMKFHVAYAYETAEKQDGSDSQEDNGLNKAIPGKENNKQEKVVVDNEKPSEKAVPKAKQPESLEGQEESINGSEVETVRSDGNLPGDGAVAEGDENSKPASPGKGTSGSLEHSRDDGPSVHATGKADLAGTGGSEEHRGTDDGVGDGSVGSDVLVLEDGSVELDADSLRVKAVGSNAGLPADVPFAEGDPGSDFSGRRTDESLDNREGNGAYLQDMPEAMEGSEGDNDESGDGSGGSGGSLPEDGSDGSGGSLPEDGSGGSGGSLPEDGSLEGGAGNSGPVSFGQGAGASSDSAGLNPPSGLSTSESDVAGDQEKSRGTDAELEDESAGPDVASARKRFPGGGEENPAVVSCMEGSYSSGTPENCDFTNNKPFAKAAKNTGEVWPEKQEGIPRENAPP